MMIERWIKLVEEGEDNFNDDFSSRKIERGKVRMYCLGVAKKKILIGKNKYIKSKQVLFNYPHFASYHAELDFYEKARKSDSSFDDIFIFGFRTKMLTNTRPCIFCANLLSEIDFKRIHFFEDGQIVSLTKKQFLKELKNSPEKFKQFD